MAVCAADIRRYECKVVEAANFEYRLRLARVALQSRILFSTRGPHAPGNRGASVGEYGRKQALARNMPQARIMQVHDSTDLGTTAFNFHPGVQFAIASSGWPVNIGRRGEKVSIRSVQPASALPFIKFCK